MKERPADTRDRAQHISEILPRVLMMIERRHKQEKEAPPCLETAKATA